jgi:hypothetical protein
LSKDRGALVGGGACGRGSLTLPSKRTSVLWPLPWSLARLRHDQGRRADARAVLAPICGWLTEGFDTPDLQRAEALLSELN